MKMRYSHWRPNGGWQTEEEFSDGTLRMIAILWTMLANNSVILFEEPELSLHQAIVEKIPELIQRAKMSKKKAGNQIFISTHSEAMLNLSGVTAVSVNADQMEQITNMMGSLDSIILLIVLCAGALAFIVIYNLTNINITERIRENALYLLDEPENSLSAARQQELAQFLEDSARFFGCQLVISTHSPFLLAMRGAKIYDMSENPVDVKRWTQLESVRTYYDFFKKHKGEF